jgi:hypothetical protein
MNPNARYRAKEDRQLAQVRPLSNQNNFFSDGEAQDHLGFRSGFLRHSARNGRKWICAR